jgi:HEAT repeat protein
LAGQRKAGGKAALIQALSDPDEAVQAEAMRALARYGAQARAATPALFAALDSAREPVRLEAARALWAAGPAPEDAPRLGALLAHDDPYVVAFAEESLYRLDAPALPVLDAALAHATPEVRKRAARLLARFGPGARASVPALARLLADDDRGVRRLAARALGSIGADARDATAVLAAASRDSDPQVRNAAAEALRRVHGE